MIHWKAVDGRTRDLVSWGTGSSLSVVVAQIEKVRAEHDGWLIIDQIDQALETTEDLTGLVAPTWQEGQINRVQNAARELAAAFKGARDVRSEAALVGLVDEHLGGVLNVVQPDRPASL
ncbi:MAG: hypothetical protein AUG49_18835 [Catenulispora sp. 13_1_20CM_3_70_7]|nr:MAG: hypothetical protein AUG49_18835 [Catenulispora sp. 13_1_20CM_3_70_7]